MNQSKQLALGLKDTGTEFTITQAKAKAQIQVTLSQAKGFQQAKNRRSVELVGLGLAQTLLTAFANVSPYFSSPAKYNFVNTLELFFKNKKYFGWKKWIRT